MSECPETGTIIARRDEDDGDELIAAAVVLPASVWERVTEAFDDVNHWPFRDRSGVPLGERIAEFLDLKTQIWASESKPPSFVDDFDDDEVPFLSCKMPIHSRT